VRKVGCAFLFVLSLVPSPSIADPVSGAMTHSNPHRDVCGVMQDLPVIDHITVEKNTIPLQPCAPHAVLARHDSRRRSTECLSARSSKAGARSAWLLGLLASVLIGFVGHATFAAGASDKPIPTFGAGLGRLSHAVGNFEATGGNGGYVGLLTESEAERVPPIHRNTAEVAVALVDTNYIFLQDSLFYVPTSTSASHASVSRTTGSASFDLIAGTWSAAATFEYPKHRNVEASAYTRSFYVLEAIAGECPPLPSPPGAITLLANVVIRYTYTSARPELLVRDVNYQVGGNQPWPPTQIYIQPLNTGTDSVTITKQVAVVPGAPFLWGIALGARVYGQNPAANGTVQASAQLRFSNLPAGFRLRRVTECSVNALAGPHGSISPAGVRSVECGSAQGYTITPDPGYAAADVQLDCHSVSFSPESLSYTLPVSGVNIVEATFAPLPGFTITAMAGEHGKISPAGVLVTRGGSGYTYTMSADPCYVIASLLVDGLPVAPAPSYTFAAVTGNHTISATFAVDANPVLADDADGDGLCDCWETVGIPYDSAGTVSHYQLPGANREHKDLYLELDAMLGCAPSQQALDSLVAAFRRAPVGNPDSGYGVTLHIVGAAGDPRVDEASIAQMGWLMSTFEDDAIAFYGFDPIWKSRFGTAVEQGHPNMLEAKSKAFHYGLCAFDALTAEVILVHHHLGRAFKIPSNHFWIALGGSPKAWQQEAGVLMHEFGHSLGLTHGGRAVYDAGFQDFDTRFKPNYKSVMNYLWTQPVGERLVDWAGPLDLDKWKASWRLDYSRTVLNTLDECHLDETQANAIGGDVNDFVPIGRGSAIDSVLCSSGSIMNAMVSMGGRVDWNAAVVDGVDVPANTTKIDDGPSALPQVLHGAEDWSRLQYAPRQSAGWRLYPLQGSVSRQLPQATPAATGTLALGGGSDADFTLETVAALDTLGFDCNQNGIVDRFRGARVRSHSSCGCGCTAIRTAPGRT
jgi:hypothetical protein